MTDPVVFILTHGRAGKVTTDNALRKHGYSGRIFYVVDDLDDQADRYREIYGPENVLVFDKLKYWRQLDTMMNRQQLAAVLYARQAAEDFALGMGLDTFCMVDDDVSGFYARGRKGARLSSEKVEDMDRIMLAYSRFVMEGNIACCCFGTHNLYMTGKAKILDKLPRKGSNVFIRNTRIPIKWMAAMNEDLITEITHNRKGVLMCTALPVLSQCLVCGQGADGGMKQFYQNTTDYERSFYAVIADPANAYVKMYRGGWVIARTWEGADPQIINEKWRRRDGKR